MANNKYIKSFGIVEESPYIKYLDENYLYGFAMSQNLPTSGLKWAKTDVIDEKFDKNEDEYNNIGDFLKVDLKYAK